MTEAGQTGLGRIGGVLGTVNDLGGKVIGALPAPFLMLCLVNLAFLGLVMWFLRDETAQKLAILNRVLDSCLSQAH